MTDHKRHKQCNGHNLRLCDNKCDYCFHRSFASSDKAIYWSAKNELKPRQVFLKSGKKFWFDCPCGHEINSILLNISKDGKWCPYCCVPLRYLCDKEDCKPCFNRSFASFDKEKVASWSAKNEKKPREIAMSCNSKFIFDCKKCGHEFCVILSDITNNKQWCPYCGGQRLCEDNNCKLCFNRSFASFIDEDKLSCWSINNCTPREVALHSGTKHIFDCKKCGHEFSLRITEIVNRRQWCPYCMD